MQKTSESVDHLFSHPGGAVYPVRPRPEWFFEKPSGLQHLNLTGAGKDAATTPAAPAMSFKQMTKDGYLEYLAAHDLWHGQVRKTESWEHDAALKRRTLEKYREVPEKFVTYDGEGTIHETDVPPRRYVSVSEGVDVQIATERKIAHDPKLSDHPHQREKRDKKKKLRDARAKAQAEVLQARIDLVTETKSSEVHQRMKAVKDIKQLAPLHNAEKVALKSAADRSKLFRFGDTDHATNIELDGFKVVTRKKGDFRPEVALMTRGPQGVTNLLLDPSIGGLSRLVSTSTRAPTSVGLLSSRDGR